VVVSGDDAAWIEGSRWLHERVIRQWDSFHVARAAYRAAGREQGATLSAALQAGERERAADLWAQVPVPGKQASSKQQKAWAWLDKHLDDPRMVRWWRQSGYEGEDFETLGHIESQVRAMIAHRMKGKGRHWSAKGLRHLAKVRQEMYNGRLSAWCGRHRRPAEIPPQEHAASKLRPRSQARWSRWIGCRPISPFGMAPFRQGLISCARSNACAPTENQGCFYDKTALVPTKN